MAEASNVTFPAAVERWTPTGLFGVVDKEKMAQFAEEERQIREENVRLQRKLQMEIERREQLCRHLSESESSLEMDDERYVMVS